MNQTERRKFLEENVGQAVKEAIQKGGNTEEITSSILANMRTYCGGMVIYIPKNDSADSQERNRKIISEFEGNNHFELSRKYGVSMQTIYKILKSNRE